MRRRCALLLLAFSLIACARYPGGQDPSLHDANQLIKQKKYNEAIVVCDRVARESGGTTRGAEALFLAAATRSLYDNPQKDYALSLEKFDEFIRTYPNNEKTRDAQNWRAILKTLLDYKRENERLNQNIEKLKKIDIRHEERRRK